MYGFSSKLGLVFVQFGFIQRGFMENEFGEIEFS